MALDADGYMVSVAGGSAEPIGVVEVLTVEPVSAGTRSVVLTGVAANCWVAGDNPREVTVVADEAISTQFDVSCFAPISQQIVFYTSRDGNMEIYVMNADGSDPVNLTNHGGNDSNPAWSPDGSQLLFTSSRTGDSQIYVMNADGSGVTNLSNMPGTSNVSGDWSPDGSQITFTTTRDGNGEVYVMNADGSGQTNLTNHPGSDQFPAWSPDGTQILFRSERDGNGEIYVMNADGSGQANLSNAPSSSELIYYARAWR